MKQEEKDLIRKGKQLSFLLRHDTENHDFTKDMLEEIVATNDKKRYEFNDAHTKIRARQGHSILINVD